MPDCENFEMGKCNIGDCPYRHQNFANFTERCESYMNGFCSKGSSCPLRHSISIYFSRSERVNLSKQENNRRRKRLLPGGSRDSKASFHNVENKKGNSFVLKVDSPGTGYISQDLTEDSDDISSLGQDDRTEVGLSAANFPSEILMKSCNSVEENVAENQEIDHLIRKRLPSDVRSAQISLSVDELVPSIPPIISGRDLDPYCYSSTSILPSLEQGRDCFAIPRGQAPSARDLGHPATRRRASLLSPNDTTSDSQDSDRTYAERLAARARKLKFVPECILRINGIPV